MKLWTITPSPSTSLPFHSQPGRGHGYLAQGEAAVVGGHQAVGKHFKTKLLQATFERAKSGGRFETRPRTRRRD